MQSLLISTTAVAIAEIGDKTQLLSLILAAKYRRPLPICLGILIATLLNHALAAGLGAVLAAWLTPGILKWIVAISFLAIGLWTLIPDTIDDEALPAKRDAGVLLVTISAFFLAEMGDKTQVATVVLAALTPEWLAGQLSRWSAARDELLLMATRARALAMPRAADTVAANCLEVAR